MQSFRCYNSRTLKHQSHSWQLGTATRALQLHLHPLAQTILVEVVLAGSGHHYYLIYFGLN